VHALEPVFTAEELARGAVHALEIGRLWTKRDRGEIQGFERIEEIVRCCQYDSILRQNAPARRVGSNMGSSSSPSSLSKRR